LAAAATLAALAGGCGGSSLADNLKSFLGAQSIQDYQCQDAGFNGQNQKLQTCSVDYMAHDGSAMHAVVGVTDNKPDPNQTYESNPQP
jgi:hypothetical protein